MIKKIFYFAILAAVCHGILYPQELNKTGNSNYIELKNRKILYGDIKFRQDRLDNTVISYNDTLRISLYDINNINNERGYFTVYQKVNQSGSDYKIENTLLRRIRNSRLQLYSIYNPFKTDNSNSYDYFSKNDSTIQEVNYQSLTKSLDDNQASMNILYQYNFFNKLAFKLLFVGLSTAVYGMLSTRTEAKYIQYFGITLSVGSVVSYFIKKNKLNNAIDIYNK